MQEKKNLDAVAEKYKAEMMRIYNLKHPDNTPSYAPKQQTSPAPEIKNAKTEHGTKHEHEPLMIHNADEANEEFAPDSPDTENCKFPTAEELMKMECECDEKTSENIKNNEKTLPAANMLRGSMNNNNNMPDTCFDSDNDRHMQGNYEIYTEDEKQCGNNTDDLNDNSENSCGTSSAKTGSGFLQAEVTDSGSGAPIAGAYVAVLKKADGSDVLETMLITDSNGMTEAVRLDVVDSDTDARPYDEYTITVYKEGFYSVNMLPVPIFDTIRSIQPVEMQKTDEHF